MEICDHYCDNGFAPCAYSSSAWIFVHGDSSRQNTHGSKRQADRKA